MLSLISNLWKACRQRKDINCIVHEMCACEMRTTDQQQQPAQPDSLFDYDSESCQDALLCMPVQDDHESRCDVDRSSPANLQQVPVMESGHGHGLLPDEASDKQGIMKCHIVMISSDKIAVEEGGLHGQGELVAHPGHLPLPPAHPAQVDVSLLDRLPHYRFVPVIP